MQNKIFQISIKIVKFYFAAIVVIFFYLLFLLFAKPYLFTYLRIEQFHPQKEFSVIDFAKKTKILIELQNPDLISPIFFSPDDPYKLSDWEKLYFTKINPIGFMTTGEHFKNPTQVKNLTNNLRNLLPKRKDLYICVDQEGGDIDKLKNIKIGKYPNQRYYGDLAKYDIKRAKKELFDNTYKMSKQLKELGFNCNFAPVIDIHINKGSKSLSYDRFYSSDPEIVTRLAEVFIEASNKAGVVAIPKHIPGHGRASDTHSSKGYVNASLEELEKTDFVPFKNLKNKVNAMMVGHMIFTKIDNLPASISKKVINDVIRKDIGFDGLLISDALNMYGLKNIGFEKRVKLAMDAGMDIIMPHYTDSGKINFFEAIDPLIILKFNKKLASKKYQNSKL